MLFCHLCILALPLASLPEPEKLRKVDEVPGEP
jgi:hypothetical protein